MTTQPDKVQAARTISAGLAILLEYAHRAGVPDEVAAPLINVREGIEQALPPWEPEPAASVTLPWSRVACGDSVQAPNGTWYAVDAVARIGERMRVHLLHEGARIESTPKAGDTVPVRRGPAGQAMDVLTAGGLELSLITSGVAA